jgi:hypothetical protein
MEAVSVVPWSAISAGGDLWVDAGHMALLWSTFGYAAKATRHTPKREGDTHYRVPGLLPALVHKLANWKIVTDPSGLVKAKKCF